MCAKDRSQNSVCSQTEFIQYLDDVFSISSSLSLIRDSQGELVHLSPLFETLLLKGSELKVWFSFIPLDVRLELFNAELNSLSGEGPYFSKNVKSMNQVLNIFIECIYVKGRKFTRWVFFPESKEGANKQVISSQADSLIKISRIWADFFPANTSNQPI